MRTERCQEPGRPAGSKGLLAGGEAVGRPAQGHELDLGPAAHRLSDLDLTL